MDLKRSQAYMTDSQRANEDIRTTAETCYSNIASCINALPQWSNEQDWRDWLQTVAVVLLQESPVFALQTSADVAKTSKAFATKQLVHAWLSIYTGGNDVQKNMMVEGLEVLVRSELVPMDVIQAILNLLEFMERKGFPLPLALDDLSRFAMRGNAMSKARRFSEMVPIR